MRALKQIFWIITLLVMSVLFLGQDARAEDIKWSDPLDPQVSVAFVGQSFSIAALLDTGAHFSVIDKKLADEMNVKRSAEKVEIYIPAAGRTVDLFFAKPFEITISKSEVPLTISPVVIDFSAYEDGELGGFAYVLFQYPLILGMEDLIRTDFFINYPDQAVGFQPLTSPFQNSERRTISFDLDVFVGGELIKCRVDTGAPYIPGVFIQAGHPRFEALREKFDFFLKMPEGFSTSGRADGTHDPKARVSALSGEGLLIEFEVHDPAKEMGDLCWIGGGVLQNVKMRRAGKETSLKSKIDGFYAEGVLPEVSYNRIGFSRIVYLSSDEAFIIKDIFAHGGAALAGIRDGDEFLSINGLPVDLESLEKLSEIFGGPAGEKVTVVVRRPSEKADEPNPERTYEITLTDVLANQP